MRKILTWIALFFIGIGVGYVVMDYRPISNSGKVGGVQQSNVKSIILSIEFEEDSRDTFSIVDTGAETTALDLLKEYAQQNQIDLDLQESSFGTYVKGIGPLTANDKHFWSFMVNGDMASEGAGSYKVKDGDVIEYKWTPLK